MRRSATRRTAIGCVVFGALVLLGPATARGSSCPRRVGRWPHGRVMAIAASGDLACVAAHDAGLQILSPWPDPMFWDGVDSGGTSRWSTDMP